MTRRNGREKKAFQGGDNGLLFIQQASKQMFQNKREFKLMRMFRKIGIDEFRVILSQGPISKSEFFREISSRTGESIYEIEKDYDQMVDYSWKPPREWVELIKELFERERIDLEDFLSTGQVRRYTKKQFQKSKLLPVSKNSRSFTFSVSQQFKEKLEYALEIYDLMDLWHDIENAYTSGLLDQQEFNLLSDLYDEKEAYLDSMGGAQYQKRRKFAISSRMEGQITREIERDGGSFAGNFPWGVKQIISIEEVGDPGMRPQKFKVVYNSEEITNAYGDFIPSQVFVVNIDKDGHYYNITSMRRRGPA